VCIYLGHSGANMNSRQYISGKKVEKKSKSNRQKLPEVIRGYFDDINQLVAIPADEDPNKPHNWYINQELYQQVHQRRMVNLDNQNLTIEALKTKLIDAEMFISYQEFMNQHLLQLYINGRKGLTKVALHHSEDIELRKRGIERKHSVRRQQAKNLIAEIGKGAIHQNDYEKFRIKAVKLGIPLPTIRSYWLQETGFKTTKKIRKT